MHRVFKRENRIGKTVEGHKMFVLLMPLPLARKEQIKETVRVSFFFSKT